MQAELWNWSFVLTPHRQQSPYNAPPPGHVFSPSFPLASGTQNNDKDSAAPDATGNYTLGPEEHTGAWIWSVELLREARGAGEWRGTLPIASADRLLMAPGPAPGFVAG